MRTLVIVPAYNEEENILRVVDDLTKNAGDDVDFIVINDCSKDSTPQILDSHNIPHIDLPVNLGLAGAVQTGYKYAYYHDYDAAIQFDGDGQHRACHIQDLVKLLEEGYDIAIGSRFVTKKKEWSLRMLGSRIITTILKITTKTLITDPTSGMRCINKRMIKDFAFEMNRRPEPDTVAYQIKKGAKVKEVQVEMDERIAGTSIYAGLASSINYMLKVVITLLFFN